MRAYDISAFMLVVRRHDEDDLSWAWFYCR